MKKICFIHAADVHLGSFLHISGEVPNHIQKIARTATMDAFRRICEAAIEHKVDFIVISGDLYDREARSVSAFRFFAEECRRLDTVGIPVFIIAGNHDPLRDQPDLFELPGNVTVFSGNKPEVYPVLGEDGHIIARVVGQSYIGASDSRKMHLNYQVLDDGIWNIGLLHTQLDSGKSNYVPCSLTELKNKNIHYWALGHIHKFQVLSQSEPVVAYSGIPQGRDFGEEGRGGCILVELDPLRGASLSIIPTASVVFKRLEVNIDQDPDNIPETITDLEDMMHSLADKFLEKGCNKPKAIPILNTEDNSPMGYVVQWIIRGRGIIHDALMEQREEVSEAIVKQLRDRYQNLYPFLWTDSVEIRTEKVLPDIKDLKHNPLFREMDKVVKSCFESAEMKKEIVKAMGEIWDERGDHENIEDYKFMLDEQSYKEIVESAAQIILEKLLGEEGRI